MSDDDPKDARKAPCKRTRLVSGKLAAVDHCSCGCVELRLQQVSLRLTPAALHELVGTLGVALARLREQSSEQDAINARMWGNPSRGVA